MGDIRIDTLFTVVDKVEQHQREIGYCSSTELDLNRMRYLISGYR